MENTTITAEKMAERMAANVPTCYIDVRPKNQTLTFTIIENHIFSGECGGLRMSIHEVKDQLERLRSWAESRENALFVVGCVTPHLYSAGVTVMREFLNNNGLPVLSIHGNHYTLLNVLRGKRLPKLDI